MDQQRSLTRVNNIKLRITRCLLQGLFHHLTQPIQRPLILDKLLMPKHYVHIERLEQLLKLALRLHKHLANTREHLHLDITHLLIHMYKCTHSVYDVILKLNSCGVLDHLENGDKGLFKIREVLVVVFGLENILNDGPGGVDLDVALAFVGHDD